MIWQVLISLILGGSLVYANVTQGSSSARCPVSGGMGRDVTPESIAEFSNRHHLTLDQTVCCLPEAWRRNYVIASNSVSAQQSDHNMPRIILFPPRQGDEPISRALSILRDPQGGNIAEVSEDANIQARQQYSIEMMDQQNGRLRFSDLRFERDMARFLRSGTEEQIRQNHQTVFQGNAQHCTTCHGEAGQQHPIFTYSPTWPNTFPKFYKPTACPTQEESQAMERERQALLQAVGRPNTAYQCLPGITETIRQTENFDQNSVRAYYRRVLNPTGQENYPLGSVMRGQIPVGKQGAATEQMNRFSSPNRLALLTEDFENNMVELHHRQFAERIRAGTQYSRYKYAIAGSLLGCFDANNPQMEKWFPSQELTRQNGVRRATTPQHAVLEGAPNVVSLQSALTCQGRMNNYQQDCFPAGCPTTQLMARNISAVLGRSQRAMNNTPEGQANSAILRSIAQSNFDLRRNWQPAPGNETRHPDPDSWGAFQYVMQTSMPQVNLTAEWSQIFTGGTHTRNVFLLGRELMRTDPELRRLDTPPAQSPCAALARESLRSFASATAVPEQNARPAQGRP